MLAAIGIILISKQVPLLIGFNKPDFWTNELFNIITFNNGFRHIDDLYANTSAGAIIIAAGAFCVYWSWNKFMVKKFRFFLCLFIVVVLECVKCVAFSKLLYFAAVKSYSICNTTA